MGISIKATARAQTKPDYTQATETAAALVVLAGEVKIWVGTTPTNQVHIVEGLKQCANVLRDTGFPDPASGDEVIARLVPGAGSPNVTVTNQTALPTFLETQVVILIGAAFAKDSASQAFYGHIKRLIEKYQEDVLKLI